MRPINSRGQLYGAPEFFSLFTGLLEPPTAFQAANELRQKDVDEWTAVMRDNFKKISLEHMCSRGEAWKLLTDEMHKTASVRNYSIAPDDLTWLQEVLSGLLDPAVEDAKRLAVRSERVQPLQEAMANLLGDVVSKKTLPIA